MADKILMKGFKRPEGITFEYFEHTSSYARFVAYPFMRGYGTTIANSLRRILLSSIPGYAVTAIRLTNYGDEGKSHVISSEFESIPHVVEDTTDIIDNLKLMQPVLSDGIEQATLTLKIEGERQITGATVQEQGNIVVVNQEQHVLSTMSQANLEIEIQIDMGWGYIPAEVNEEHIEVVGTIPIDAVFSPIRRVKYHVENTRVGHRTDFDKIIMEIWTNGAITPENAVADAARIAREHFTLFMKFDSEDAMFGNVYEEEDEHVKRLLSMPLEELELSVRSSNCLKNVNILTVGDLTAHTENEVLNIRNFGKKSMQEIKEKLRAWNLRLGMTDYREVRERLRIGARKQEVQPVESAETKPVEAQPAEAGETEPVEVQPAEAGETENET